MAYPVWLLCAALAALLATAARYAQHTQMAAAADNALPPLGALLRRRAPDGPLLAALANPYTLAPVLVAGALLGVKLLLPVCVRAVVISGGGADGGTDTSSARRTSSSRSRSRASRSRSRTPRPSRSARSCCRPRPRGARPPRSSRRSCAPCATCVPPILVLSPLTAGADRAAPARPAPPRAARVEPGARRPARVHARAPRPARHGRRGRARAHALGARARRGRA
jgi:hypothetical protein